METMHTYRITRSGRHFSKRLWSNRTKLKEKIEEQITQAVIQGKDLNKIIRDIRDTMDVSKDVAARLINTEHAYACAQGDLKMYEELGVDEYEYLATLDIKTSNICRSLDGRVFKLEDATPGLNFPPMHPHCRSTTVPVVDDKEGTKRIAKDENGKNIYLRGDVTYKEYEHALKNGNWGSVKVVKSDKPGYNIGDRVFSKDVTESGAVYFVRDASRDMAMSREELRQEIHAYKFYNAMANRDSYIEAKKIHNHIKENEFMKDFTEVDVRFAYEHVFYNEHDFRETGRHRFDPEPDMAHSWGRLSHGKCIEFKDLVMLRHERLEYHYMEDKGMLYEDAHELAEDKYNYSILCRQEGLW